MPENAIPALAEVSHQVEAQLLVGQRGIAAIAAEAPLVLAAVLEDDLFLEVVLHNGVNVPTGGLGRHGVFRAQEPPSKVKALLVAVDDAKHEVRVLGVPKRHSQLAPAACLVDHELPGLERDFAVSLGCQLVHAEDAPDIGLPFKVQQE